MYLCINFSMLLFAFLTVLLASFSLVGWFACLLRLLVVIAAAVLALILLFLFSFVFQADFV